MSDSISEQEKRAILSNNIDGIKKMLDEKERRFTNPKDDFVVPFGRKDDGSVLFCDMHEIPSLLIAGTVGSGKSMFIKNLLLALMVKNPSDRVQFVIFDSTGLEYNDFIGTSYCMVPNITNECRLTSEIDMLRREAMDRYYGYKRPFTTKDERSHIFLIIDNYDELYIDGVGNKLIDLISYGSKTGIHTIITTTLASKKALALPLWSMLYYRMAFAVPSAKQSRDLFDISGAEKLEYPAHFMMKMGPHIYKGSSPMLLDSDLKEFCRLFKQDKLEFELNDELPQTERFEDEIDELMEDAIEAIFKAKQASISMLQRTFKIGYNRAARIIDEIEARGIIGPQDGTNPRQLLITEEEYYGRNIEISENDMFEYYLCANDSTELHEEGYGLSDEDYDDKLFEKESEKCVQNLVAQIHDTFSLINNEIKTLTKTAFCRSIFYINKYFSLLFIIEGVIDGMTSFTTDIPYRLLYLTGYWLFAIAGVVSYLSCRKTNIIWLALVLFFVSCGVSCAEMRIVTGKIDYPIFIIELIPLLLNAIRYYWLAMGKVDRLTEPPKHPKRASHRTNSYKYARPRKCATRSTDFARGSGDKMVDEIMDRYSINEKQARARIRSCQRDLDAAMDDGCMDELEDIVAEQLGNSDYTDYLI